MADFIGNLLVRRKNSYFEITQRRKKKGKNGFLLSMIVTEEHETGP